MSLESVQFGQLTTGLRGANRLQAEPSYKVAAHQGYKSGDPYEQYDRELSPVVTGTHLGSKFDSNNIPWYAC